MHNHPEISPRKTPKDFKMSSGPLFRGSLHASQEEDEDEHQQVSCFICSSNKNNNSNKNPFSARGLEKFSALLAELEEKRKMIYSQIGSQDIFVRFVFPPDSNDVKPIVVKLTNNNDQKKANAPPDDTKDMPAVHNLDGPDRSPIGSKARPDESDKETMQKSLLSWNNGGAKWFGPVCTRVRSGFRKFLRKPPYFVLATVILILLLLAIFGRTIAVACACVGWYVLPTIRVGSKSMRVVNNKKTYLRKLSGNKKVVNEELLSSPKFGKNQQRK